MHMYMSSYIYILRIYVVSRALAKEGVSTGGVICSEDSDSRQFRLGLVLLGQKTCFVRGVVMALPFRTIRKL